MMSDACGECHSAETGCDLGVVPCCNCLEQGYIKNTPALAEQGCTASVTPQGIPTSSPRRSLPHNLLRTFGRLYRYLDTSSSQVLLAILFSLPLYYFSQASELLAHSDTCHSEYDQWIKDSNSLPPIETPPVVDRNVDDPNYCAPRAPGHCVVRLALDEQDVADGQLLHNTITLSPTIAPPCSIVKLQYLWCNYLDSRIMEWRILTTTACVFVAASPTLFQIPEADDDPITRSVAFLALCRALSGIIFGPIFLLYFRRSHARSAHFAFIWCQKASRAQHAGILRWSPWIMLSLPAVSTCWATLFYLLAIFSFIWRTGSTADPSPTSADNPGYHPMAIPLAMAVRITITTVTVVDIGCLVWVWRTLGCLCRGAGFRAGGLGSK